MATTPSDLTPEWLTDALSAALNGSAVVDVETTPVGTGQVGQCVRLALTYSHPTSAPRSIVAKLPAVDPTSRATAAALRNYEIEVNFYSAIAGGLPIRTPCCYHAHFDSDTTDFVLLLEDVAPATQGDQLAGCSIDSAAVAVRELPGLHAPRWGDAALKDIDWLHRNSEESSSFLATLLAAMFPAFCERYDGRIDHDIVALGERLMAGLATYSADRPGPWTIAHGDYRLDNLLFGDGDASPPVVVVDWQTVAHGPGVSDLSYFIGAGLVPDDRRRYETELVRAYHEGLRSAGVDLTWNDVWSQYRRYTFAGLIMAIAASSLVERTERGDDMFVTMAQRHGRHAIDLEAADFLP
jgi:hypothetical protein